MEQGLTLVIDTAPELSLSQRLLNTRTGMNVTTAVTSLGLLAGGEAIHAEPVAAEDVSAIPAPETTPTALTPQEIQQCRTDILAKPEVLRSPRMSRAGIRTQQGLSARFHFIGVHEYCAPEYTRAGHVQQYMKKEGEWVKIGPPAGVNRGNEEDFGDYLFNPTRERPADVYSECINGKFQKDKLILTMTLKAGENRHRKIIDKSSFSYPTEIHGHCAAAIRSHDKWD